MIDSAPRERVVADWSKRFVLFLGYLALGTVIIGSLTRLAQTHMRGPGAKAKVAKGLSDLLYADNDTGVWNWYNASLLAILAVAFVVNAAIQKSLGRSWREYAILAFVATYLSVDENVALHEKFGPIGVKLGFDFTYAWLAIGIPIALLVGIGLWRVAKHIPRTMRRRLVLAAAIYLGGAVGLESIGGALVESWGYVFASPIYIFEVTIEELMEACGVLVAVWAALSELSLSVLDDAVVLRPTHVVVGRHRSAPLAETEAAHAEPTSSVS